MKPISFEQQIFKLTQNDNNENGLPLSRRVPLKDIILKISWKPFKIATPFSMKAYYFDNGADNVQINYSTYLFTSPVQYLFLGRQQQEYYKDNFCRYISFKSETPESIEINIAAYEFDDEDERETFLIRKEVDNPKDGTFPTYADAL